MRPFEKNGIAAKVVDSLKKEPQLFEFAEQILNYADMNTNTLKNFISYVREISLRDSVDYPTLSKKLNLSEILYDPKLSGKSKGKEIISRLYNLRYPLWHKKQTLFTKLKNRFYAATGGKIVFPDFAEGNSFQVLFTIQNSKDIEKILSTILKAKPIMEEALHEIQEKR